MSRIFTYTIYVVKGRAMKSLVERRDVTDKTTTDIVDRKVGMDNTILYRGHRYDMMSRWHSGLRCYVHAIFPQDKTLYSYPGPSSRSASSRRIF